MDVFEEAIIFAVGKHSGQIRKRANAPYITHPMEVASVVSTMTNDREVLAAAVLHDTVEDTDTTLDEICEKFGRRVMLLVMTETEDKRANLPPAATWKLRKEESLLILKNTKDDAVKMMWLGDKLSNMRSFAREYTKHGDALWNGFNQKDPNLQAWYYRKIAKYLEDLKEYDAYKEYTALTEYVFKNYKGETEDEL